MSYQANTDRRRAASSLSLPEKTIQLPFFVYGTLRPGQKNYALLRGYTSQERPATAQNLRLHRWGELPVAIVGEGLVVGNLLTINSRVYDKILILLDRLEGYYPEQDSLYRRVQYPVLTAEQKPIMAWLYQGDPLIAGHTCEHIPHGDWIRFHREQLDKYRSIAME